MLLLVFMACSSPEPELPRPPDIVLVVVDTLRADHLGMYGYERPTTPDLDRLAAEGMVFDRAYSHAGWTLASFASIYSGLLPHQHLAMRAADTEQDFGWLQPGAVTVAELLKAEGYRTASFSNNTFLDSQFGLSQGFDVYNNSLDRQALETTDLALEWLALSEEPSFVVVHWFEPHMSYDPAARFRGRFASTEELPIQVPLQDHGLTGPWKKGQAPSPEVQAYVKALYDEEILSVNEAFAHLNEGLSSAWEQTRLAFTSDHGEEFWDHGAFEHGHSLYSELTRVPLVLMGEGIPKGRSSTMVAHQDLYTTLASWGGAAHSAGYGGLDLLSLAASDVPGRSILSESTLYGGAKMSLVKRTHRLVLDQAMGTINLMCMDRETLIEEECAEHDADWEAVQESMYQELFALRGHLNPVVHTTELRKTLDRNTADRLEALGYLE